MEGLPGPSFEETRAAEMRNPEFYVALYAIDYMIHFKRLLCFSHLGNYPGHNGQDSSQRFTREMLNIREPRGGIYRVARGGCGKTEYRSRLSRMFRHTSGSSLDFVP